LAETPLISLLRVTVFTEDIGRRRSLYRLAIARNDTRGAQQIAIYAETYVREVNELWIPLQDAFVAAYARPFTSNKPFGPLASQWSKFGDAAKQVLHHELLQMRDELVAHADASQRSVVIFPPGVQPPVPGRKPSERATLGIFHKRRSPAFFSSVRELCDDLFGRLHAAVEAELQALFGEVGPIQPFDLLTGEAKAVSMDGITIISEGSLQPPEFP